MHVVKTLFLTPSSLPLVQLWRGRLRLDGFESTLHMQNVQLGPSGGASRDDFHPARQIYPGGLPSVSCPGLSRMPNSTWAYCWLLANRVVAG
jgi:hypothetical protein